MSKSIIRLLLGIAVLAILLTGCSDEPDPIPSNGTDSNPTTSSEAGGQATPPSTCSDSSDPLPLHTAVAESDSGLPGVLANLCPEDLNNRGADGQTPLSLAIGTGNEDLVRMLLEAGVDPNMVATKQRVAGSNPAWDANPATK